MLMKNNPQNKNKASEAIITSYLVYDYFGDATPKKSNAAIWDGYIEVYTKQYHDADGMKKIDAQIKGTTAHEFELKRHELEAFASSGGAMVLVVVFTHFDKDKFDKSKYQIFYSPLLKNTIQNLLASTKNKKIEIPLVEAPNEIAVFHRICLDFIADRELQMSNVLDFGSFNPENYKSISIKTFQHINSPYELAVLPPRTFTVISRTGQTGIISDVKIAALGGPVCIKIISNGQTYYDMVDLIKHKECDEFRFGSQLILKVKPSENCLKIDYSWKLNGTIEQILHDINFLISFFKYGIQLDTLPVVKTDMDDSAVEKTIEELLDYQKEIEIYKEVLEKLGVKSKYYPSKFSDEEKRTLHRIHNKDFKNIEQRSYRQIIDGKNIFFTIYKNDYYSYYDLQKIKGIGFFTTIEGKKYNVSPYLLLKHEAICASDNFNPNSIRESINVMDKHSEISSQINALCLEVIHCYDKTKKPEFLELADNITQYLIREYGSDVVYKINQLQIKKRISSLNKEEKKYLVETKNSSSDLMMKCAINILLDATEEFEILFESMSAENQQQFKSFPIFNLHLKR